MSKKVSKEEPVIESQASEPVESTEKEELLKLYNELKVRNIRSISDLENLIARA